MRKSIKIKIERLFIKKVGDKVKFYASIRDYLVEKAKKEKKDLVIFCEKLNDSILVPYEKLGEGIKNEQKFYSKIDNRTYSLVDYEWKRYKNPNLDKPEIFSQLIL